MGSDILTTKKSVTVAATEFKAHCLELMERVRRTGVKITITKHGKPVAQMVLTENERRPLFASLPVKIVGDIRHVERRALGAGTLIVLDTHAVIWYASGVKRRP